jgi:hypothetical protein
MYRCTKTSLASLHTASPISDADRAADRGRWAAGWPIRLDAGRRGLDRSNFSDANVVFAGIPPEKVLASPSTKVLELVSNL